MTLAFVIGAIIKGGVLSGLCGAPLLAKFVGFGIGLVSLCFIVITIGWLTYRDFIGGITVAIGCATCAVLWVLILKDAATCIPV